MSRVIKYKKYKIKTSVISSSVYVVKTLIYLKNLTTTYCRNEDDKNKYNKRTLHLILFEFEDLSFINKPYFL